MPPLSEQALTARGAARSYFNSLLTTYCSQAVRAGGPAALLLNEEEERLEEEQARLVRSEK